MNVYAKHGTAEIEAHAQQEAPRMPEKSLSCSTVICQVTQLVCVNHSMSPLS